MSGPFPNRSNDRSDDRTPHKNPMEMVAMSLLGLGALVGGVFFGRAMFADDAPDTGGTEVAVSTDGENGGLDEGSDQVGDDPLEVEETDGSAGSDDPDSSVDSTASDDGEADGDGPEEPDNSAASDGESSNADDDGSDDNGSDDNDSDGSTDETDGTEGETPGPGDVPSADDLTRAVNIVEVARDDVALFAVADPTTSGCAGGPGYRLWAQTDDGADPIPGVASGNFVFRSIPEYREGPQIVAGLVDRCDGEARIYTGGFAGPTGFNDLAEISPQGFQGKVIDAAWDLVAKQLVISAVDVDGTEYEIAVAEPTGEIVWQREVNGPCVEGASLEPNPELPQRIDNTRLAVIWAASRCDYIGLLALTSDDFSPGFGGATALETFESGGADLMAILVRTFELDGAVTLEDRFPGEWRFPTAAARLPGDYTDEDLADLERLAEVAGAANSILDPDRGYTGYRAGINEVGQWTFFVAGD